MKKRWFPHDTPTRPSQSYECQNLVVGSRGIRRRKPKQPRKHDAIGESGPAPLDTSTTTSPAVMWPETGFEASPNSPAGEIQGLSRFAVGMRGLQKRKSPLAVKIAVLVIIGLFLAIIVVGLLSDFIH
jgi:hypothetical protein